MKKTFNYYAVIWFIALALFNVIAFAVPAFGEREKYTVSFWIGYAAITVASIGQLACVWYSIKVKNINKVFFNMPIVKESFTGMTAVFVIGYVCMLLSAEFADWLALALCVVILGFSIIAVLKASMAASVVNEVEEKVKTKTFFIKSLTVDAESLCARAEGDELKALCKTVYEAVRYSDPMSDPLLEEVESRMTECFAAFAYAVKTGSTTQAQQTEKEFTALAAERNSKCKLCK